MHWYWKSEIQQTILLLIAILLILLLILMSGGTMRFIEYRFLAIPFGFSS